MATPVESWPALRWRGQESPPLSEAECIESCLRNAEDAARSASKADAEYQRLPAGDPKLAGLRHERVRFAIEQAHWRKRAEMYRAELAERERAEQEKRSRIVGEDDGDDEAPGSAWAEMGYQR